MKRQLKLTNTIIFLILFHFSFVGSMNATLPDHIVSETKATGNGPVYDELIPLTAPPSPFDPDQSPTFSQLGVWYSCVSQADGIIRKPFLIIEGVDPLNQLGSLDPTKDNYLYDNFNPNGFLDDMLDEGYDIFILNNRQGGGRIDKNAMSTVKAIEYINERCNTDNELMVLGTSLGGLQARFALAYMEDQGIDHHCKVLVSFDAPQKGAVTHVGIQHALNDIRNGLYNTGIEGLKNISFVLKNVIDSDVAKQTSLLHHSGHDAATETGLPAPDHLDFFNTLNGLNTQNHSLGGYPARTRNIAFARGSGMGTPIPGAGPGDFVINTNVSLLVGVNLGLEVRNLNPGSIGSNARVAKISLTGALMPVHIINQYDYVNTPFTNEKPLDGIPGATTNFQQELVKQLDSFNPLSPVSPNATCQIPSISALDMRYPGWDWDDNIKANVPGFNSQDILYNDDYSISPFDVLYINDVNEIHDITAMTAAERTLLEEEMHPDDLFLQDRMIASQIPNQKVRFESQNTITVGENVTSTITNGEFRVSPGGRVVLKAKDEITLKPGATIESGAEGYLFLGDICSTDPFVKDLQKLSGPESLCQNQNGTFIATSIGPNIPYQWELKWGSGTWNTLPSTGVTANVFRPGGQTQKGYLKVSTNSPVYGFQTVTWEIDYFSGTAPIVTDIIGPNPLCPGFATFTAISPNGSTYQWKSSSSNTFLLQDAEELEVFVVEDFTLKVAVENVCGATSFAKSFSLSTTGCQFNRPTSVDSPLESGEKTLTIYPNPAKEETTIGFSLPSSEGIIHIWDLSGKEMMKIKTEVKEGEKIIPLHALPQGMYILSLVHKGQIVSTQKLVKE